MIEGKRDFSRNLQRWENKGWEAAKQALLDGANDVLSKSVKECPVDTGTLRRSGTVEKVTDSDTSIEVALGYNTEYAIYVHENLSANHPKGKAKFLEDPVNENMSNIEKRIVEAIKGVRI